MAQYGKASYWDERYERDAADFDWYQKYAGLKTLLNSMIPKNNRVLMVGCGNSVLSSEMADDGYSSIHNIDISSVVIEAMQEKYRGSEGLTYSVDDITALSLEDGAFEAAIDKGTLDALLCGSGSVENADKALSEISRVLTDDGVFVMITYGAPESRLTYLEKDDYGWTVSHETVAKPHTAGEEDVHHVYVMKKSRVGANNTA